jgi:hypothetical protein
MSNERIVLLGILTVLMFGVFSYSQSGAFILPFGLLKTFVFVIGVSLVVSRKKRPGMLEYLVLGWGLLLMLSSLFVYQLFFPQNFIDTHEETFKTVSSACMFGFYLTFFFWQLAVAFHDKTIYRWLQLINATVMFTSFMFGVNYPAFYIWLLVPTLMWITSVFAATKENTTHAAMAGFVSFVILACWISGYFFGLEEVLANL